jgi:D-beta-D-heptose 7-phosphate kinase/D-beta-D-heptose 1-phosphate adenosyltransferase
MKIFLNGTFDILHTGHLKLINYAKSLGNYLYVSVDSDERVKEKKGHKRPINKLSDRIFLLENLKSVDKVLSFSTDFELTDIIKDIKPDIMIVGSDYKDSPVIGAEYSKSLLFFERIPEYATTNIIQSIIDRG